MTTTAIASTSAEATSATITLTSSDLIHVFSDNDLKVGERVTLEISPDAGSTWYEVVNEEYRGVVLNDIVKNQTVGGPGVYRLRKTATGSPVAIYYE